ncbi:unnamed protein product [Adineta steineri]|uniref:Uncharacterized protein n=1 Tax=Adineta steineri TaxID=433720 RepID=A0A818PN26_9BILA|nr:unnamed protein product [Adineta steineri]CAF1174187.1 unnamed protein product [Adineta steineri]CAF1229971.1 unnamed protein product [Adineta steineri]CAF3628115.1 unnamed protein product [Adineta steineri]CAF3729994.1 unnamed protein product [Adineta steineri]
MKFQRRILPPHSSTYLEMEEYTTPSISQQSISITGSASDLSEIESVCSLSANLRQKSDSLTNLFNMSEDNTSLSNLSIASYSLSQHSYDNSSPTIFSSISSQPTFVSNGSEKTSRLRRSVGSSTTSSQKNFSIKTAETVLNTIGMHTSSSDTCGLIAHDGNNIENIHDNQNLYDDEQNICSSSDENDNDIITSQTNRGLRKTVLNNVDRLLNSANKQIKL